MNVQTHLSVWSRAVAPLRLEDAGWDSDCPQPPVYCLLDALVEHVGVVGGVLLTPSVTGQTGQTKMASVGGGAAVALL